MSLLVASPKVLTTYGQETAPATNANGVNWVDLLDRSVLAKETEIWGIMLTIAGGWAGLCEMRIVTGGGTKTFPFAAQAVENTDFVSGIYWAWPAPIRVPIANGYKVQFRSTAAGDGAGKTCALTELAKIEIG